MMITALKQIPEIGILDFDQECHDSTVSITCLNLTQTELKGNSLSWTSAMLCQV